MSRKTTPAGPPPPGFTPGPRHKVFGISDDLLNTTRAILMGQKPVVEKPEEEADENKQELAETNEALSHDCANHVKSEQWGAGQCIPGMHTIEETSEEEGVVTHYDVMFEHGIEEDVPVEDLEIVSEKHHSHKKSMKEDDDDDDNGDDDENGNGKSKKKSKKSKKLDKVDPDELEGSHDERDDEDIDNDDDVDDSDKYLHKRRKAIHKATKKESAQ